MPLPREARPTLLVFSLGPCRERDRSPLLPDQLGEVELALREGFLEATLDAGRESGCRLAVSSPAPLPVAADVTNVGQRGSGFGDRLAHAVCRVQTDSREPLLIAGSDVPGLAARHLRRALDLLAERPDAVVLGPSPDGGIYLLAARRPLEPLARAGRWCRRDTLRSLLRYLRRAGIPALLLEPLRDLDAPADLEAWLSHPAATAWRRWVGVLRRLLAALRRPPAAPVLGRVRPALAGARAGRGPPAS